MWRICSREDVTKLAFPKHTLTISLWSERTHWEHTITHQKRQDIFFFQKCQGTNGSLATNNKLNKFTWRVRTGNANIYRSIVNCNTFRVKLPTSWSIIFSEMTSSWNVAVPFTGRGQMNKNNNKNRSVNDAPSLWVGRWTNQRHLTVYTEARATDGN